METKDKQEIAELRESRILKIFEDAGMRLDPGMTYSVKGQVAQLLNGAEKLIDECTADEIKRLQSSVNQLKRYFQSNNDIPVEMATIKAKDFWRIVGDDI